MRLYLNLATQPYENARNFYLKWGALLAAVLVLTVALVWAAVVGVRGSRDVKHDIDQKRSDIARLQLEEKQAEAKLNAPENRAVRDQSEALNELFARKALSWTAVFTELEHLMPARVHLVSMAPRLDPDGQLELNLNLVGDSREKALELLRHLEDSRHFRYAQLRSEAEDQQGGGITFQITALYVPASMALDSAARGAGGAP